MDWLNLVRAEKLSLPERLSIDLERLILEGELKPGEKLPAERELAETLKVSRVSVREALRELENRGLIDRRPGRGTVVLSPGENARLTQSVLGLAATMRPELSHIMELRAIVEPPIAKITAIRATTRDITQLRELVEAMEQDVTKERYAELDRAFHQAIAQYTHNPLLTLINEQIALQIEPSRADRYQTRARRAISSAAHRRIFEAIESGDGDLAEHEARKHVLDIARQIEQDVNKERTK